MKPAVTTFATLIGIPVLGGIVAGLLPALAGFVLLGLILIPVGWIVVFLGLSSLAIREPLGRTMLALMPLAGLLLEYAAGWKLRGLL